MAKSRSLFVATPPLILALLDDVIKTFETGNDASFQKQKPVCFLSNRASHCGVHPSTPHSSGFRAPCVWAFLISPKKLTFPANSYASRRISLGGNLGHSRHQYIVLWRRAGLRGESPSSRDPVPSSRRPSPAHTVLSVKHSSDLQRTPSRGRKATRRRGRQRCGATNGHRQLPTRQPGTASSS